jgi:hypothetical protein
MVFKDGKFAGTVQTFRDYTRFIGTIEGSVDLAEVLVKTTVGTPMRLVNLEWMTLDSVKVVCPD